MIALNVLKVCREKKQNGELFLPLASHLARASMLTGVPERSLVRFRTSNLHENSIRKVRSDKLEVDDFDRCVIRRTINDMLVSRKVLPTVKTLLRELRSPDSINFKGGRETLRKLLKQKGFTWRKCSSNRRILMERSDVVAQRINFPLQIKKYRDEGRHIVYTDETYVNGGHTVSKSWQSDEIGLNVPFNKGERMIIVHAGSKDGFIPGAKVHVVYKAGSSTGDYHKEMNFENFRKWLENQLLPNLKPNSVLILDNAAYHNVQEDRCPTSACRKGDIQDYLRRHEIPFGAKMLKAELLEIYKRHKRPPVYIVDEILRRHGHLTLRLPPYHADLNAIELIWADVKGYIARKNLSFKFSDVKVLIDEAFNQVSSDKWSNCCSHVKTVEEKYWSTDIAVENEIEKIVIYVDNSESGTVTEDELETYDEDTEDDEQYRADVYDCETEVDVRTDEDTLTADTLTADTEDSCSGDATLTGDETLSAED